MEDTKPRAVRRDVLRNRALLLAAADEVIREHGMDLSLNAVAHTAGVGVGTVYRHFPDRDALITALFEHRVDQVCSYMTPHLDDEDPVAGLKAVMFGVCEMQALDRGLWEVMTAASHDAHREIVRTRVSPIAAKLVERANATGRLRENFDVNDLPVLLWTGGALNAYLGAAGSPAWRRYVTLMFDSFLCDDDPVRAPIEQQAPTFTQVDTAMRSWRGR